MKSFRGDFCEKSFRMKSFTWKSFRGNVFREWILFMGIISRDNSSLTMLLSYIRCQMLTFDVQSAVLPHLPTVLFKQRLVRLKRPRDEDGDDEQLPKVDQTSAPSSSSRSQSSQIAAGSVRAIDADSPQPALLSDAAVPVKKKRGQTKKLPIPLPKGQRPISDYFQKR